MANFEIQGVDELLIRLDKMVDNNQLVESMEQACALVERSAKMKAPKDTGELRRSIESKVEETSDGVVGVIFSPVEYAPYIEYGTGLFAEKAGRKDVPWHYQDDKGEWHSTSGMRPQPYLRPALHENKKDIVNIIQRGITND